MASNANKPLSSNRNPARVGRQQSKGRICMAPSQLAANTDKLNQLNTEVVLLKSILVNLVGAENDGTAGLVTRMNADMRELKSDMNTVKAEVKDLTLNVEKISRNVEAIIATQASQSKQTSWKDGWNGVATFIGAIAAAIAAIAAALGGLYWLAQHTTLTTHSGMF